MASAERVVCTTRSFPHRGFDVVCGEHKAELAWYYTASSWKLVIDGADYQIRKEGLLKAGWKMWRGASVVMSALQRDVLNRRPIAELDLDTPIGALGLERVPIFFVSGVDLFRGDKVLARMAPPHMFSSRVEVTLYTDVPFQVLCFALCLSAEMRRVL